MNNLGVTETGEVMDDRKANQFKASYHNMEHCLLNSLYLSCWIKPEPVKMHFKIRESAEGELLYPLPIEMLTATITEARINDQPYSTRLSPKGAIRLPALSEADVVVTLQAN